MTWCRFRISSQGHPSTSGVRRQEYPLSVSAGLFWVCLSFSVQVLLCLFVIESRGQVDVSRTGYYFSTMHCTLPKTQKNKNQREKNKRDSRVGVRPPSFTVVWVSHRIQDRTLFLQNTWGNWILQRFSMALPLKKSPLYCCHLFSSVNLENKLLLCMYKSRPKMSLIKLLWFQSLSQISVLLVFHYFCCHFHLHSSQQSGGFPSNGIKYIFFVNVIHPIWQQKTIIWKAL